MTDKIWQLTLPFSCPSHKLFQIMESSGVREKAIARDGELC